MLNILWQELTRGLPSSDEAFHVIIRLVAAMILGGIVGVQRESTRKPAGLRTHMLVSVAILDITIQPQPVRKSA